ncbi:MAG: carboxypeptidase regulatory-like domain-containing protein [Bryobacteraceae bacterium]
MRRVFVGVVLCLLATSFAMGQIITSTVRGTVADPSGAVVVGATCTLTNQATGQSATATSMADGGFTFPNVLAGDYRLSITAAGFKALTMENITVSASEMRALGRLTLNVGETKETVTVTAEAAAIQLASAERSGVVTGNQLSEIAIKGRDLMSFLATIPGVVDVSAGAGREAVDPNAAVNITINGNPSNTKNVTVDGVNVLDTGNNTGMHYEPNMEAVGEVRVLSSNYQAEHGRMGGGAIIMVTKGGTQEFHGSVYDFYRHESLNANDFFNNRNGVAKSPYRYRITGYSIGGPIFIPNKFNANKDKLFFFFSQEFGGIKMDRGFRRTYMPTALEREGDFSKSYDLSGALIVVKDPTTGAAFPGNKIPSNRFNLKGQTVLKQFPLPNNYVDAAAPYAYNYIDSSFSPYPKRQEIGRVDYNPTSWIRIFGRFVHSFDEQKNWYGNWPSGSTNYKLHQVKYGIPGDGQSVTVTMTFSPTFIGETTFGRDNSGIDLDSLQPEAIDRAKWGDLPKWYTFEYKDGVTNPKYMPDIQFGGQPSNTPIVTVGGRLPWKNVSRNYDFSHNMTKITGVHQVKFGLYVSFVRKSDPTPSDYRGSFNFSRNTLNPFDTGNSFSNALLGIYSQYQESNARPLTMSHMWSREWYAQDNWRVNNRLTLDYGLRFYWWGPCWDEGKRQATFDASKWDPAKAPYLYVPALNAQGVRVAKNPVTGALEPTAVLIGKLVPNTGDVINGMAIGGVTAGVPRGLETFPKVALAPRFGFAYDVFGNGGTAIRGGFGINFSRASSGMHLDTGSNPPARFTPVDYYGNIATLAQSVGALGPLSVLSLRNVKTELPVSMSYSFGIQQRVKTVAVDVSYVGNLARHLYAYQPVNFIPMYGRFDPAYQDPTRPGTVLLDDFMRPFRGYTSMNLGSAWGSSNYHALQASANRRISKGLQFGAAYTFSKVLGTTSANPYFNHKYWSYGPQSMDRSQVLVFNYIYDVPKLGERLNSKPLGWILDNWKLSGITSFIAGSPYTPSFTLTDGAATDVITGSAIAGRIVVTGDPRLSKSEKTFYRTFDTSVFKRPAQRDWGNAGNGILRGPGVNNWDLALSKTIPFFSERFNLNFRGEFFNAWNHTQFSSVDSTARFNPAGQQINTLFGSYTATRTPRTIQFSLKLAF